MKYLNVKQFSFRAILYYFYSQPSLWTDQTEEMPSVPCTYIWTSLTSSFTWLRLTCSLFTPNIAWHWFSTLHLLLEHSDSYRPTTSTFRTSFLTYSFRSFSARARRLGHYNLEHETQTDRFISLLLHRLK